MKQHLKKKLKISFVQGIATGSIIVNIIFSIICSIGNERTIQEIASQYFSHFIAGLVVALTFSVLSLVYELDRLNMSMRICLHLVPSFIIYFLVAYYMKWLPVGFSIHILLTTSLLMIIGGISVWLVFYLYYHREAARINQKLKTME